MKHRRGGEGSYSARESCAQICLEGFGEVSRLAVKEHIQNLLEYDSWVLLFTCNVTFCACTFPILEAQLNVGLVPGGSTNPHESSVVRNAATYILPKRNRAISWIHDNLPNLTNPPFQSHKKMKTTQAQTFISVNCRMSSTSVH